MMTVYVGLLRAVNLASHNKIGMRALCDALEAAGMRDVRSLLQSGNVVFRSSARSAASLEATLEKLLKSRLDLETTVLVRSAVEWSGLVAGNPFKAEASRDPGHLLAVVLKNAVDEKAGVSLRSAIVGRERVEVDGRVAYVTYPDGIGRSRLTLSLIEKHLGSRATGRNWNTVLKLAALASQLDIA